jgi:hypothetical protein
MRTLVTLGLGALAMYLLDPEKGQRRRALIRDQLARRGYGASMEARSAIRTEPEAGPVSQTPQGARHLGR